MFTPQLLRCASRLSLLHIALRRSEIWADLAEVAEYDESRPQPIPNVGGLGTKAKD